MLKNRNAVAAGILALALIVGGFALWNNQKATDTPVAATENPVPGDTSTSANTDPTGTDVTNEPGTANEPATPATTDNTPGAGQSTEPNTAATNTIPATHTVKANETLRDIAMHYYGDPIYSADIERVNNIEDANHIVVGTELKLPKREELNDTTPTTAPASGTNETGTPEAGNNDTPKAENNTDADEDKTAE
ncbi:MAG: hypothetical protein K0R39_3530 [Symbiobacteriaceae bacterium]|jgi:hypothetical protein|nr:hypothetical protein [Symbiobacteriaceae bacterium]